LRGGAKAQIPKLGRDLPPLPRLQPITPSTTKLLASPLQRFYVSDHVMGAAEQESIQ